MMRSRRRSLGFESDAMRPVRTPRLGGRTSKPPKGGNGGPRHIHLRQEKQFIVHTGVLVVRRGGERLRIGAGEDVRIAPKTVHTFKAEAESTFTVEFRPALRVWEFFTDLFALPTVSAATRASAISPAWRAPTPTSFCTCPTFQSQSSGHLQCRSRSSDWLLAKTTSPAVVASAASRPRRSMAAGAEEDRAKARAEAAAALS
jgi:hypothetical protein